MSIYLFQQSYCLLYNKCISELLEYRLNLGITNIITRLVLTKGSQTTLPKLI